MTGKSSDFIRRTRNNGYPFTTINLKKKNCIPYSRSEGTQEEKKYLLDFLMAMRLALSFGCTVKTKYIISRKRSELCIGFAKGLYTIFYKTNILPNIRTYS